MKMREAKKGERWHVRARRFGEKVVAGRDTAEASSQFLKSGKKLESVVMRKKAECASSRVKEGPKCLGVFSFFWSRLN